MSQVAAAPSAMVRVSILSEDRRLDVGIPASLPLVELMPGFARSLGVLDPSLVHGGYALRRADGTTLDQSLSATAQGTRDGDLLTLVRGTQLAEPRVYDDVTEAVIDATSERQRPWLASDSARTALAISLTFLALCAVLLFSAGPSARLGVTIAAGATVILLAASATLGRLGQVESGHALGLSAAVFAGLGGFLAVPDPPAWGWPLAAAAFAAMVVGGIALALSPERPEVNLVPVAWGAFVLVPALITAASPDAAVPAFAMMIAVGGALGNLLPWLAFSSTRIRVISPQSDQDVVATPPPIDAPQVKARAAAGARVLSALRMALGLAILLATPLIAGHSVWGVLLTSAVFLGMMFQSRQAYARVAVMIVMALGAVGLAATCLTVAFAQPDLRPAVFTVVLATTALLILLTLLSPGARLRLARVADTAEVILLALVLPLGALAAGWV